MRPAVRGLLPLLVITVAAGADAVVDAANEALAAGDAFQAVTLLAAHPESEHDPAIALLRAQALLRAGRIAEARRILDAERDWPERWLGRRLQLSGECRLAAAQGVAAVQAAAAELGRALEAGGEGVEVDRCLLLIAEAAAHSDQPRLAERAAERVWIGWRRGPHAWSAGLLLADLLAADRPRAARRLLTDLRHAAPSAAVVTAAEDRLCALLLADRPTDCLGVAQAARDAGRDADGRFTVWAIRALLALDPARAREALMGFDPEASDPRLEAVRRALAAGIELPVDPLLAALADWDAGRQAAAVAALEELAATDATAWALMAWKAGREPASPLKLARPVAVVAAAHVRHAQDPASAHDLLAGVDPPAADDPGRRALERRVPGLLASLLQPVLASAVQDPRLGGWRAVLREPGQPASIAGVAWAWEAQRLTASKAADAAEAWRAAAERLPADHPWAAAAAARAARGMLLDLPPGSVAVEADAVARARLEAAARLLSGPAWAGNADDHLACRWLLAQALAQQGGAEEARQCVDSLRPHADPAKLAKLERFVERLAVATHTVATQVLP